jgi:hypothetical protein
MTKKLFVVLALMATALLSTNSFGTACSSGAQIQFLGAGSSAQFNSFAYGIYVGLALNNSGGTGFWTTGSAAFQDTRFSTPPQDTGVTVAIGWDSNAVCNIYGYVNIDSGVGVKDFFAMAKSVAPGKGVYGAVYGVAGSWTSAVGAKKVPGINDSAATLPIAIQTLLTASPAPTSATQIPQPGCGQFGVIGTGTIYCFFTAGMTDIRPEDALYATTRALSSYNTTNGLSGLGYNNTTCGAVGTTQGCGIHDAFNKGKNFNVLSFKLTGTDPVTAAALPVYTTLTTGAAPLLVLANNSDTSSLGLGNGYNGTSSNYTFKNINRNILANVFEGTVSCTGDLLPGAGGSGQPLNVVLREPLSGTYNAFEFTAVRTLLGSASTAVSQHSISTKAWMTNDDGGQEYDPYLELGTLGPATNFTSSSCTPFPTGSVACGDPYYVPTGTCGSGKAWKARAVGSGEEVAATIGTDNVSGGLTVADGIGYAFWSYQNFAPTATGCQTGVTSGNVTCTSYLGHYLTVDSIDPLYENAGTPVDAGGNTIPGGSYNAPQCGAVQNVTSNSFPCQPIAFPHVQDGSYPLWSQLRFATFANVTNKQVTPHGAINMLAAAQTEVTDTNYNLSDYVPLLKNVTGTYYQGIGSVTVTGATVTWASGDLFDSVHWTTGTTINIAGTNFTIKTINNTTSITLTAAGTTQTTPVQYLWNAGSYPVGSLNLGVYRSHYLQSAISPQNGHDACTAWTSLSITGGNGPQGTGTCLVDLGGDMGGSVMTVQSDIDFHTDFGSTTGYPKEFYGQHQ